MAQLERVCATSSEGLSAVKAALGSYGCGSVGEMPVPEWVTT